MNNYKTVFFAIGILLIILGAFMLIPFFVQIIYDEKNSTFLSSTFITLFIGVLLVLTNLEENKKLNLQQAFLLTALSWISIAIFGSLPFFLSSLDFSFIDADKISYQKYFERSLCLIRKGGIIAIDNVLWGGKVLDSTDNEPATRAIREFNKKLYTDDRVSISMIPIGDGLTLARKL